MKVLVTGSRAWSDYWAIYQRLARLPAGSVVVHGDASGADKLAKLACVELRLTARAYPADWDTHGKKAGPIRNQQMLNEENKPEEPIELVLAWPLAHSKGTRDMCRRAESEGIPVEYPAAELFA